MKKSSLKRIGSLLVALTLALSVMPVAFATETQNEAGLMTPEEASVRNLPAFPGAEGGGKYTTGGRGGEVYRVTNLNDDGEGSLRDAVSQPNRIVVFDVSGTIYLESSLNLKQPNITVAGQTAPGDGICIADYNLVIDADNIIIRYLRIRPGDISESENDAVSARYHKFIVIDHCSTSWSTDETMSLYAVANTTVQWCVITESLTLAKHAKGRHGYGGIWGGSNVTYHHNLLASHTSRTPRYGSRTSSHPDFVDMDNNDMVNNLVYNWGFNSSYGAEEASVNVVNNYYKSGPITNADVRGRLWNPSKAGIFYFSGNVVEGFDDITKDNKKGIYQGEGVAVPVYLDEPLYESLIPMDNVDTAEVAYEKVLDTAGATLPKRDSYDAKMINDVRNGTGRSINNEDEVGGWPELLSAEPLVDTDNDGMPDEYEAKNGFDATNPSDGKSFAENGYTNLENYLNGVVENASEPHNPTVTLDIDNNSSYDRGSNIELKATAKADTSEDSSNKIEKVQFFRNDEVLGEDLTAPYSFTYENADGEIAYMSARAIDKNGEATTSEIKVININGTGSISPWNSIDIGEVEVPGSFSLENGVYTVKGSGIIGSGNEFNIALGTTKEDTLSYMYQTIDENAVLSTEIDSVSKLNNNCASGLMLRDELTKDSDFVMINYEYEKGGAGLRFAYRLNGEYTREFIKLEALPRYIKLVKDNNSVLAFHSVNGLDWNILGQTMVDFSGINYGGVVQDGNKETNEIASLAWGKFSNLTLDNYGQNSIPGVNINLSTARNSASAEQNQYYTTDEIQLSVTTDDAETLNKVEIYIDGKLYNEVQSAPYDCTISGLKTGSHYVTAIVYDEDGAKNSDTMSIAVSKLPIGWDALSVGDSKMRGAFDFSDNGDVTIYGSGYGIADVTNENYPYAFTSMNGDFTAKFKIEPQDVTEYDHFGFVVRDGVEPGDNSYAYYFQIYNGEMYYKNSTVGTKYTKIGQQKYKKIPVWLKLTKAGNKLTAEYSPDGNIWTVVGEEDTTLAENYFFGLFGSSAEDYRVSTFNISGFELLDYVASSDRYVDMQDFDWANEAVNYLTDNKIVNGVAENYFAPSDYITRAEFAKMLVGAYESEYGEATEMDEPPFIDIDSSEWYYNVISKIYYYGFITGVTDVTFEPNRGITREEMATMLSRVLKSNTIDYDILYDTVLDYSDVDSISDWARPYVEEISRLNIMQGDELNNFNPLNFANRAESAVVIYRMLSK